MKSLPLDCDDDYSLKNTTFRITPDLMKRSTPVWFDDCVKEQNKTEGWTNQFLTDPTKQNKPKITLEDSMKEVAREVLKSMEKYYSANALEGWKFPDEYNDVVRWYRRSGLPPIRPYPWLTTKNVQELVDMAVDSAAKNNNKKENKMQKASDCYGAQQQQQQQQQPTEAQTPADIYPVSIDMVENGFIIKVGCKTFVSTDWKEAAKALGEYFDKPITAMNKYCYQKKGK